MWGKDRKTGPKFVSSANSQIHSYITYFIYPSTGINNSKADLNFRGGPSGNFVCRHVYGLQDAKPYIEEEEGVLDIISANFERTQKINRGLFVQASKVHSMTGAQVRPTAAENSTQDKMIELCDLQTLLNGLIWFCLHI